MDKFKGAFYAQMKVVKFEDLTRGDIINGDHLLIQIGRGGIDVYKVFQLAEAYKNYGYLWIQERMRDNHIILQKR